ncbi:hypothetical protein HK097_000703 [Rhizophlyctis rosea]|uniref:VASt domain-containing protein n=1 Tax=Rhizophlyctis rosea TaxID=64517 RepID=A0AAD5X703_9FUNG|nr:hypothetical protein HK097_000703 [Rhizophlyctis rosea]
MAAAVATLPVVQPRPQTDAPKISIRPPSWHENGPDPYPFLDEVRATRQGRAEEQTSESPRARPRPGRSGSNVNVKSLRLDSVDESILEGMQSPDQLPAAGSDVAQPQQEPEAEQEVGEGEDQDYEDDVDPIVQIPYAIERDNDEFHRLFPIIPEEEKLLDDYACALNSAGVLIQGRMWISQYHVGFKGWTQSAYICKHYAEIKAIEKRNVALVIPNAIEIITPERSYFLASFLQRDVAFDILMKLWDHHNPTLAARRKACEVADNASVDNVETSTISEDEGRTGSRTRAFFHRLARKSPRLGPSDADVSDTDQGVEGRKSNEQLKPFSLGPGLFKRRSRETLNDNASDNQDTSSIESAQSTSASTLPRRSERGDSHDHERHHHGGDAEEHDERPMRRSSAPPERPVRECHCLDKHKKMTTLMDKTYPIDIADLWGIWYGAGGDGWYPKFLEHERKLKDLQVGTWVAAGAESTLTPLAAADNSEQFAPSFAEVETGYHRKMEYVMPLTASIGPKQTKCMNRDEVLDKTDGNVCIQGSSITPDVPSGGAFSTVTRACLMNVGTAQTRVIISGEVSWSKTSWLKAAIDKGVIEGMRSFNHTLDTSLQDEIQRLKDQKSTKADVPASVVQPSATPKAAEDQPQSESNLSATEPPPPKPPRRSIAPAPSTPSTENKPLLSASTTPLNISRDLPLILLVILTVFFMVFLTVQTLVLWKLAGVVQRLDSRVGRVEGAAYCAAHPNAAEQVKWDAPKARIGKVEERAQRNVASNDEKPISLTVADSERIEL